MSNEVYKEVLKFKNKYPATIAWRLKSHSAVVEKHLNPGEEVLYAFAAQKNETNIMFMNTTVVALTNRRLLFGTKRLLFGYFLTSITPDMFNDLSVSSGLIWGTVYIDTIKEFVTLTNVDKQSLPEIETHITEYMMEEKKKYKNRDEDED